MKKLQRLTFVLGGAASGKSAYAEALAIATELPRTYVATAQPFDEEMRAKIAVHRALRGPGWTTIEAPLALPQVLGDIPPGRVILLDCVTLWLSNLLLRDEPHNEDDIAELLSALGRMPGPVIVVSNEVGQGIVPDNALARRFRAMQGGLNRSIAEQADTVVAVMAGLPLALKGELF